MMGNGDFNGVGLPGEDTLETVLTGRRFEALDNFFRTFAIRPGDRMVFLADRKLDPRVIHAICGLARARGVRPWVIMGDTTQYGEIPPEFRPTVEQAIFVVSSWFCSIIDPFCIAQRAKGQRWVKITYFRDLDLLDTDQARFPGRAARVRGDRDGRSLRRPGRSAGKLAGVEQILLISGCRR